LSLRRADSRFVLPTRPHSAVVLGKLDDWRAGLIAAGVEVSGPDDAAPAQVDLVVASSELAVEATRRRADLVIVEGGEAAPLEQAGYHVRRLLLRPRVEEPTLVIPLDQRLPAAYAARQWSVVDRRWKDWRSRGAAALLARGIFPARGPVIVATRQAGLPYLVEAARSLGLPREPEWVLTLGQGDPLSRNLFHLFAPGEVTPSWVLKFARVPGYAEPFDRDELGLTMAAKAGPPASDHVPRLLGRIELDGEYASVETAAVGKRLRELLQMPGRHARKLELIKRVADWIIELGLHTATPNSEIAAERQRLAVDVLPHWIGEEDAEDLLGGIAGCPAVLQHNDVGSWNVVATHDTFTVVDWESARRHGLPLWDLVYFMADALAVLDGSASPADRHTHTADLFRGDLPSSQLLFDLIRRAVVALEIRPEAVGPITTLCWLHHSLSHLERGARLDRLTPGGPRSIHGLELIAETWLADPALGPDWDAWRSRA
jgi:hypothetical protein